MLHKIASYHQPMSGERVWLAAFQRLEVSGKRGIEVGARRYEKKGMKTNCKSRVVNNALLKEVTYFTCKTHRPNEA